MDKSNNYYSMKNLLSKGCVYNVMIGERSNGKTFQVHDYSLEDYKENGNQLGLIRRWDTDFTGKRGQTMFDGIVNEGRVKYYFGDKWDGITYYSSRWFLSKFDRILGKKILDDTPFAYGFAINTAEHDKSTSYPKIKTVFFDEFLTRNGYIPDEFITFQNIISTIVRDRNDVKIFMAGNTVNKYCPYFKEMGLTNIEKMKEGSIDIYHYGDSELTVAVEYTNTPKRKKKSDMYFAFNNPKLEMITKGKWEMAIYPHCPTKFTKEDIVFTYFIEFEGNLLQCEIVRKERNSFTFIHRKTTDLKKIDKDLIFSQRYTINKNIVRRITKPKFNLHKKILSYYDNEKVFYQDNEIGEIVRNYFDWCKTEKIS